MSPINRANRVNTKKASRISSEFTFNECYQATFTVKYTVYSQLSSMWRYKSLNSRSFNCTNTKNRSNNIDDFMNSRAITKRSPLNAF